MNKTSFFAPLLIGLVVGVLAAVFLPGYVRPYLPGWAGGKNVVVEGTVEAKQKKDKSLLLTVGTKQGVLLATFTRRVDEINLLINEKDRIEFTLPEYAPFIEDPRIVRVMKEGKQPVAEPAPGAKPKEQAPKAAKVPQQQENQPAAGVQR